MMKVNYADRSYEVYGDFHTHSFHSGYGMASPEEIVKAAKEKGLEFIGIIDSNRDEFSPIRPYLMNELLTDEAISVLGGREVSLFTDNDNTQHIGLNLCGWHYIEDHHHEIRCVHDTLRSYQYLMEDTDIMSSPDRVASLYKEDSDAEEVLHGICKIAMEREGCLDSCFGNTLCFIEINTAPESYSSLILTADRQRKYLYRLMELLATEYQSLPIVLGSDARCTRDIAHDFGRYLYYLEIKGIDLDRVLNLNKEWCNGITKLSFN